MSTGVVWMWILFAAAFAVIAALAWLWVGQDPEPSEWQVEREAMEQLRMANAARLDSIGDSVASMHRSWFDLRPPVNQEAPEPVTGTAATGDPGVDQLKTVRLAGGAEYRGLHCGDGS